ncbi:TatD family hydrolase [Streptococcus sp. CSL10205-OR2]|uniref:TatD family hydrolase n=1 Tax=Streptococcus sp. CSL10205-OR2 TaxID=2980558 RepID=UPI0021D88ED5|nr:TatD family hydrolase [Streptococcus sp. CSL10205-OR2]MCU9533997.1 TatD family hydrolase [Streptococcus sp. CSL10205-OR2]
MKLIDFHCHPDLYNNNFKILESDNKIVFMTNLPVLFEKYYPKYKDSENTFLALGYHPELIEEYPNCFDHFKRNLRKTRFVGEVGLDNSESNKISFEKQLKIFRKIMDECNQTEGKIISIHSRKSERYIFEELVNNNNIYILHWYTGDLKRLLNAMKKNENIYISVNLDMVTTKKGVSLIDSIPLDKIVLETDAPFTKESKKRYDYEILEDTSIQIAKIKQCKLDDVIIQIQTNSKKILR